jgi:lipopolysaccharide transport system ATP-binding protein
MSDLAIRSDGLGKRYRIGAKQKRYNTLRDTLVDTFAAPVIRAKRLLRGEAEGASNLTQTLWALDDVSFEVQRGEVVGIIGHNGAGKSTLLKILSRITEPTRGTVDLYGRVGSLLEVGTGFHPELTGRENVYLNGAILGMPRIDINRKFDEIVAFAEIEEFIDTPVKHYSSGMGLRLGFAVAAYLEPDILIVDEVLAVGDMSFQAKCMGKMENTAQGGRTVLFVSHNLQAMLRLCPRVILMEHGKVIQDGPADQVISYYQQSALGVMSQREWTDENEQSEVRLLAVRVKDGTDERKDVFDIDCPLTVEIEYEVRADEVEFATSVAFYNADGLCLFVTQDTNNPDWQHRARQRGIMHSEAHIPAHFFAEGMHSINVQLINHWTKKSYAHEKSAVAFTIADRTEGTGVRGDYAKRWPGVVRPMFDWTVEYHEVVR